MFVSGRNQNDLMRHSCRLAPIRVATASFPVEAAARSRRALSPATRTIRALRADAWSITGIGIHSWVRQTCLRRNGLFWIVCGDGYQPGCPIAEVTDPGGKSKRASPSTMWRSGWTLSRLEFIHDAHGPRLDGRRQRRADMARTRRKVAMRSCKRGCSPLYGETRLRSPWMEFEQSGPALRALLQICGTRIIRLRAEASFIGRSFTHRARPKSLKSLTVRNTSSRIQS